jgi:hypothetical protein
MAETTTGMTETTTGMTETSVKVGPPRPVVIPKAIRE